MKSKGLLTLKNKMKKKMMEYGIEVSMWDRSESDEAITRVEGP